MCAAKLSTNGLFGAPKEEDVTFVEEALEAASRAMEVPYVHRNSSSASKSDASGSKTEARRLKSEGRDSKAEASGSLAPNEVAVPSTFDAIISDEASPKSTALDFCHDSLGRPVFERLRSEDRICDELGLGMARDVSHAENLDDTLTSVPISRLKAPSPPIVPPLVEMTSLRSVFSDAGVPGVQMDD